MNHQPKDWHCSFPGTDFGYLSSLRRRRRRKSRCAAARDAGTASQGWFSVAPGLVKLDASWRIPMKEESSTIPKGGCPATHVIHVKVLQGCSCSMFYFFHPKPEDAGRLKRLKQYVTPIASKTARFVVATHITLVGGLVHPIYSHGRSRWIHFYK